MKKTLSLLAFCGMTVLATSCSKESIKDIKKQVTTNAKSQGTSSGTASPSTPVSDHQGGCPNHSSTAG